MTFILPKRRLAFHHTIHDCFLRTEGLSGLNLLLDNDSHLLFVIFQTSSIAIKSPKLTCQ